MVTAYVTADVQRDGRRRVRRPPACCRSTRCAALLLIIAECLLVLAGDVLCRHAFLDAHGGRRRARLARRSVHGRMARAGERLLAERQIVTLGEITSLVMPSESIWRRAAFEMQTPLAGSLSFSPFANVSIPSGRRAGLRGDVRHRRVCGGCEAAHTARSVDAPRRCARVSHWGSHGPERVELERFTCWRAKSRTSWPATLTRPPVHPPTRQPSIPCARSHSIVDEIVSRPLRNVTPSSRWAFSLVTNQ